MKKTEGQGYFTRRRRILRPPPGIMVMATLTADAAPSGGLPTIGCAGILAAQADLAAPPRVPEDLVEVPGWREFWRWAVTRHPAQPRVEIYTCLVDFMLPALGILTPEWAEHGQIHDYHVSDGLCVIAGEYAGRSWVIRAYENYFRRHPICDGDDGVVWPDAVTPPIIDHRCATHYAVLSIQRMVADLSALAEAWCGCGVGSWGNTISAMGVGALLRTEGCERIVQHDDQDAAALEWHAYRGGYVWPARIGPVDGRAALYDCASLYPHVMSRNPMPGRLLRYQEHPEGRCTLTPSPDRVAIADMTASYSRAPAMARAGGRNIYLSGRVRGVYSGPELAQHLGSATDVSVWRVAEYEAVHPFGEVATDLLTLRSRLRHMGQPRLAVAVKHAVNSIYGKLGQRLEAWRDAPGEQAPTLWGEWLRAEPGGQHITRWRALAGRVQYLAGHDVYPWTVPAVAGAITAGARHHMRQIEEHAGPQYWLYTCMDSVILREGAPHSGYPAGAIGCGAPGSLRQETGHANCHIHGVNWVEIGDVTKIAGIPDAAIPIGRGAWEYALRTSVGRMIRDGSGPLQIPRRTRVRKAAGFRGGVITADGSVRPYTSPEEVVPDAPGWEPEVQLRDIGVVPAEGATDLPE
jgi:hypothetical protein